MTGKQNLDTRNDSQVTAIWGDNAVLQLGINSPLEVVSVSWLHEGKLIIFHEATDFNLVTNVRRYTSTIKTIEINRRYIMLNITSSKYKDAGFYACEVHFQTGFPVFKEWTLQVQGW